MKKNKLPYRTYTLNALFCLSLLIGSCKKEVADTGLVDPNSLNNVISNSFNLSIFKLVLSYSRQDVALKEAGPYTVLVPADAAFTETFPTTASVAAADRSVLARMARYHIMDGKHDFSKLPLQFNQELRSGAGKMYVTRWIKGSDTILTINGAKVLAAGIPASNGLIHILSRVLIPYVHEQLGTAIAAEPDLSIFYQAVLSSGMLEVLNGTEPYTVFAPNNLAMQAAGYATVAQVSDTDPEVLKLLVRRHIILNRRFIYDYILGSKDPYMPTEQNMLDGGGVSVYLVEDWNVPGTYNGIYMIDGIGNYISVIKQDMLSGNGVLHIVDTVLSPAI